MRAVDIIAKKRDGGELTREEIDFFIQGYNSGEIPDYQASAWAMAVVFKGMTPRETTDLTLAMANSGEVMDLRSVVPIAVDKHSTGGVGDKTTLVVEPVVAACGLPVGKLSGRGLGFSGGTLDKMESIPGFRTNLSTAEFLDQLREIGLVLSGQSADLAPADGKLYALRDTTATVNSVPLIASSVMSKKIAGGANAVLLDVKVGEGAFMRTLDEARELARLMVGIGRRAGRKTIALLSDMNQPLGQAVGNALEVKEAISALQGAGPRDLREHCLEVAGYLLLLGGRASSTADGRKQAEAALDEGRGWERFRVLVGAQGGNLAFVDDPERLPRASLIERVPAPRAGYLSAIGAQAVGEASVALGAGRRVKEDPIDHSVGFEILHNVGDRVEVGEDLFVIHANDPRRLEEARQHVLQAHRWSDIPVEELPLFYGVVE